MGYDCVGALECMKPYKLPKHTDPSNWDPQASNGPVGGLLETCSRSCATTEDTMTPIVFFIKDLGRLQGLCYGPF